MSQGRAHNHGNAPVTSSLRSVSRVAKFRACIEESKEVLSQNWSVYLAVRGGSFQLGGLCLPPSSSGVAAQAPCSQQIPLAPPLCAERCTRPWGPSSQQGGHSLRRRGRWRPGGPLDSAQHECACGKPQGLSAERRNGLASDRDQLLLWTTWCPGARLAQAPPPPGPRGPSEARCGFQLLRGASPPRQGSHWQLGLHVGTANMGVHGAIKWPACPQDGSPSSPVPWRRSGVSSALLALSGKALSLSAQPPRPQTQPRTLRPAFSLSLPSELQASGTYCLSDAPQGPTTCLDSPCP